MVHKFSMFGYRIAVDVESGCVHSLSEAAYELLGWLDPDSRGFEDECPADIRYSLPRFESPELTQAYCELRQAWIGGTLFSKPSEVPDVGGENVVKAMCLLVSGACNMRCRYCFASPALSEGTLMSLDTGKKAVDMLMERSKNRRNLEIDFFGGEPLLNLEVVRGIEEYASARAEELEKNVRFTLTTNGTLLDDGAIDFINAKMANVVLSIDGRRNVNDKMRTHPDGSGVYGEIIEKYKTLVERRGGLNYYVRGTFTSENLDFAEDALHLASLGFRNISIEPVVADENEQYVIKHEHLPRIFDEYERLAKIMIDDRLAGREGFNFFHFDIDPDAGPCLYKRIKGCGAGFEYIAVDPSGIIYPCHQFAGDKNWTFGSVDAPDFGRSDRFKANNIVSNKKCAACFAKYYCGGGCAANNAKFNSDISSPYRIACEMEKKRVECAIMVKALSEGYMV